MLSASSTVKRCLGRNLTVFICGRTIAAFVFFPLIICTTSQLPTHKLCEETGVIPTSTFGSIQYTRGDSSPPCTITLMKPTGRVHRYAVIEGIRLGSVDECLDYNLTVMSRSFCIVQDREIHVFDFNQMDRITINATGDIPSFSINFYFTVFICNGAAQTAGDTVLAGYISSDPPSTRVSSYRKSCSANMKLFPANATVRFEAKDFSYNAPSAEEYYLTIGDSRPVRRNDVVLRTSDGNGQIEVQTYREGLEDDGDTIRFNYKYTVLQCDTAPQINRTSSPTPINTPILPGTVVHYQCIADYMFSDDSPSSISCDVNETLKAVEWSGIESLKCVPVSWCIMKPIPPQNTIQTVVSKNRTISLECEAGYESAGQQSVIITCNSTDEDNIPWIWNDTDINEQLDCQRVQCDLSDIYNLSNGRLDNLTQVYKYKDTVDYNCDEGFTKTVTESVRCMSNKTWSAVPRCKEALCNPLSSIPHGYLKMLNSEETVSYSAGTLLIVKCAEGYKVEGEEVILCYYGDWTSVDQESLQGVPTCVATSDARVAILGSMFGVVLAALVAVSALAVIKIRRLSVSSQKSQKAASKGRPITNDEHNNHVEYEDVATAPSRLNSTFTPDQPSTRATTYENTQIGTGGATPEYVQINAGQYEMVNKDDSSNDQHVYTSLNN